MTTTDLLASMRTALDKHGIDAVCAAKADLAATSDPDALGINALSWLGNRVSFHLRRAVLLEALEAAGWNLTHTALALGLCGTSQVHKLMAELNLGGEYEAAKARGLERRGGRTKRVTK